MHFTRRDKSLYAGMPSRFQGRFLVGLAALLGTISIAYARANESLEILSITPSALAFARYVAFLNQRDVFTESGPVSVEISALLPRQATQAYFRAIRDTSPSERSAYEVVQLEGNPTDVQAIVRSYLSAQAEVEKLPLSAVLITPANYKFRCIGSRDHFGKLAYVFQISPRESRLGLIKGELWIDAETGVPIRETGHFVKPPSGLLRGIDITRDVNLHKGVAYERITHAVIDMPSPIYRAELKITERPLKTEEEQASVQVARGER